MIKNGSIAIGVLIDLMSPVRWARAGRVLTVDVQTSVSVTRPANRMAHWHDVTECLSS